MLFFTNIVNIIKTHCGTKVCKHVCETKCKKNVFFIFCVLNVKHLIMTSRILLKLVEIVYIYQKTFSIKKYFSLNRGLVHEILINIRYEKSFRSINRK